MEGQQPVNARLVQLTISGRRRNSPLIEVSLYRVLTGCKTSTSRIWNTQEIQVEGQQPVNSRLVQLTISGRRRKLPLIEVSLFRVLTGCKTSTSRIWNTQEIQVEGQQPVNALLVQLTISGRRRNLPLIEVSLYRVLTGCKTSTSRIWNTQEIQVEGQQPVNSRLVQLTISGKWRNSH